MILKSSAAPCTRCAGMLRSVRATAAEQLAASLQSLDPQQQQEAGARATCELLEQAVSSFRERLVGLVEAPDGSVRNAARAVTYPGRSGLRGRRPGHRACAGPMGHKNHPRR